MNQLSNTRREKWTGADKKRFLLTLSFGDASIIELESLEKLQGLEFEILAAKSGTAMIECTELAAYRLISRVGGAYKISRILAQDLSSALEAMVLPFNEKFDWTISGYECSSEILSNAKDTLREFLKSRGLGRSKFLEPEIFSNVGEKIRVSEINAREVQSRIIHPEDEREGVELVVHGDLLGKPVYAQTVETTNYLSYEERDLMRPYQDPTKTLNPRIARMLVNMAVTSENTRLLDPFCGLGTILQEALICRFDVVGVDRDQRNIHMTRENLQWIKRKYKLGSKEANLFAYDARRISSARMPKVNAIASEPILLPVFKKNPSPADSKNLIDRVATQYDRCLKEFCSILEQARRVVITSPILIDSSGKRISFSLENSSSSSRIRGFHGRFTSKTTRYPCEIDSRKKKIIQRAINVYEVC